MIRHQTYNPSNILFVMCLLQEYGRHLVRLQQAGLINLENTHLRHEAEQRRGHIIHTLYHIYSTIVTISTALYFPYLQSIIHIYTIYSTISTYTISTALYLPYPGWPRSHSRSSCFPSSSSPAASPQLLQLFSVRLRAGDIKFNIKGRTGR